MGVGLEEADTHVSGLSGHGRSVRYLLCALLSLSGCTSVPEAGSPACPHSAGDTSATRTVEPPATVTFDEVEITVSHPPTYFGTLEYRHSAGCECLASDQQGRWRRQDEVRSPCVIACFEVLTASDAYAEILRRGLGREDATYWQLLDRANEAFYRAVEATIRDLKLYDVVLPYGSMRLRVGSRAHGIPDITHEVMKRMRP